MHLLLFDLFHAVFDGVCDDQPYNLDLALLAYPVLQAVQQTNVLKRLQWTYHSVHGLSLDGGAPKTNGASERPLSVSEAKHMPVGIHEKDPLGGREV